MSTTEQMTIVIVGHVDHGKSTVIGRLLADTGSLPDGKLEFVKDLCSRTAKPFEYAFLLDALKDERNQGITIDSARIFFNTAKRRYLIFDAPGHIEFLKNMVTGASHAQAALLVIDAHEGIKENSRRHGYLLSMLGIKQVSVLVNKMDVVGYSRQAFNNIAKEYSGFLEQLNVEPVSFIPISALHGENIAAGSRAMPWYDGLTVLEQLDAFAPPRVPEALPFRMPVQDIYKFTAEKDDRRIVAGTVESGALSVGEEVVFWPSGKSSVITTIEEFNKPPAQAARAGQPVGFTLAQQVYIKPGEIMTRASDDRPPLVGARFRANIFWMGKTPLQKNKTYRLKLASGRTPARVVTISTVLDASDLTSASDRSEVAAHEVAEIILETDKPIAYDTTGDLEATSRFVLVDGYEIAGGGIILAPEAADSGLLDDYLRRRSFSWVGSTIARNTRTAQYGHSPAVVIIVGPPETGKIAIARALEALLIGEGRKVYYLGMSNLLSGLDSDISPHYADRDEHLRRLGELAHIATDAGLVFIATASDVDKFEIERLSKLAEAPVTLVVAVGPDNADHARLQIAPQEDPAGAAQKIRALLDGLGVKS